MLVSALRELHGLDLPLDCARDHVSDHLDYVATMMRISRRAAQRYVTDDVIRKTAARLAEAIERHDTAVSSGDVSSLDARRERRYPRPPGV